MASQEGSVQSREAVPPASGGSPRGATSDRLDRQISQALSHAASRGQTRLEKKSAWPFDFYQAGKFYPVDYHYWWTPYKMDTGHTQLTMMHAVAYAEDGSEFAADQMEHRHSMRAAHRVAYRRFAQATAMYGAQDTAGRSGF